MKSFYNNDYYYRYLYKFVYHVGGVGFLAYK